MYHSDHIFIIRNYRFASFLLFLDGFYQQEVEVTLFKLLITLVTILIIIRANRSRLRRTIGILHLVIGLEIKTSCRKFLCNFSLRQSSLLNHLTDSFELAKDVHRWHIAHITERVTLSISDTRSLLRTIFWLYNLLLGA